MCAYVSECVCESVCVRECVCMSVSVYVSKCEWCTWC